MTKDPEEPSGLTANFTGEDLKLYPCLCEMLHRRGLPLQAQYTTVDTACIFGCDVRSIQERIHCGKWRARDLPKRGRFLSCDLEAFLQMPLSGNSTAQESKGGRK